MKLINKILPIASAFFLGVIATSGITLALAHGGDTNLIHACVKTSNGSIKIVGANDTCGAGETALDWNIQGIQGPPGPAGVSELPFICQNCSLTANDPNFRDDLAGKDMSNAYLYTTEFQNSNLAGNNFTNAVLWTSDFRGANLTGANFTDANITEVRMDEAILTNSNLTNANLTGATGVDTTIRTGIIWSNTTCPDGSNSDDNGNTCEGHLTP